MFMIWDSRLEGLQLFWLNFQHWLQGWVEVKYHKTDATDTLIHIQYIYEHSIHTLMWFCFVRFHQWASGWLYLHWGSHMIVPILLQIKNRNDMIKYIACLYKELQTQPKQNNTVCLYYGSDCKYVDNCSSCFTSTRIFQLKMSISYPPMILGCKELCHQQPWYWP